MKKSEREDLIDTMIEKAKVWRHYSPGPGTAYDDSAQELYSAIFDLEEFDEKL